jgi:hypothetical protein
MNLNRLTRANLGLSFRSSDRVVTSIKFVQVSVNVLRDGNSLNNTGAFSALAINFGEMDRGDSLYHVEVVIVHKSDSLG